MKKIVIRIIVLISTILIIGITVGKKKSIEPNINENPREQCTVEETNTVEEQVKIENIESNLSERTESECLPEKEENNQKPNVEKKTNDAEKTEEEIVNFDQSGNISNVMDDNTLAPKNKGNIIPELGEVMEE